MTCPKKKERELLVVARVLWGCPGLMRCPELSIAIACSLLGNFSTISASFQSNLHRQLLVNWFPHPFTPLSLSLFHTSFLTFSRPSPGAFLWFLLEEKSVSNLACQKPCRTKESKKEREVECEGERERRTGIVMHFAHCTLPDVEESCRLYKLRRIFPHLKF